MDGDKVEVVTDFIFLGSNITADGDCSHEIKSCMLIGRKAMTNFSWWQTLPPSLSWKCKSLSPVQLFVTPQTIQFMEYSRPVYWVDSCSLLQGIFPTQESNRGLLLGRQILYQLNYQRSLDNILKSSDMTLLTKVCIVKAMVFPVVMHRCKSWIMKKTEHWRKNWCFWVVVLDKILESPLDSKEIKPVNPKEINTEHSLEELVLKLKLQ